MRVLDTFRAGGGAGGIGYCNHGVFCCDFSFQGGPAVTSGRGVDLKAFEDGFVEGTRGLIRVCVDEKGDSGVSFVEGLQEGEEFRVDYY